MLKNLFGIIGDLVLCILLVAGVCYIVGVFSYTILTPIPTIILSLISRVIGTNVVPWFFYPGPMMMSPRADLLFYMVFGLAVILILSSIFFTWYRLARRKDKRSDAKTPGGNQRKLTVISLLAVLTLTSAAWAGEGADTSPKEERMIQNVLQAALIRYGASESHVLPWRRGVRIDAKVVDSNKYMVVEIQSRLITSISLGNIRDPGMKSRIENKIQNILNPSAREELGRSLLK